MEYWVDTFRLKSIMIVSLLAILVLFGSSTLSAQTRSTADIANYRGADREEMLRAGAKKEVHWGQATISPADGFVP